MEILTLIGVGLCICMLADISSRVSKLEKRQVPSAAASFRDLMEISDEIKRRQNERS